MRKVYEIPMLHLMMIPTDVITASNGTVRFDDEQSLGKNDQTWSGFQSKSMKKNNKKEKTHATKF